MLLWLVYSGEMEGIPMKSDRRTFLQAALGAGLSLYCPVTFSATEKRNGMPYRTLGKTGEKVSLLCLGGYHIGTDVLSDEQAVTLIRRAVDEGVNFLDNAWSYNGGRSEERMGAALRDGYRDKVFLMTKHKGRDAKTAQEHLETSLRRLRVDVIDLWQFHEIVLSEEPARIYSEGALDVALKAKEQGKIRYIGFTGHRIPTTHVEMIARGFPWDTVQMPLNVLDHHYRSFEREVLPKALAVQIGVIAMKTLGGTPGAIPQSGAASVEECLRYAMSLPVATVCCGLDSMEKLERALKIARDFTPMTPQEKEALLERVKPYAVDGKYESYKSS